MSTSYSNRAHPVKVDHDLLNFLINGEFGLVSPSQPHSYENQCLLCGLKSIKSITDLECLRILMSIYVMINRLNRRNMFLIEGDELIKRYFWSATDQWNKSSKRQIDLSVFRLSNFGDLLPLMTSPIQNEVNDTVFVKIDHDRNILIGIREELRHLKSSNNSIHLSNESCSIF